MTASKIRIRNHDGVDLVTISMDDAKVTISEGANLGDGARAFWDAIETVYNMGGRDIIMRAPRESLSPGDVTLLPGTGDADARGGDVNFVGWGHVHPNPNAPKRVRAQDRTEPPPGYNVFFRYGSVGGEDLYGWDANGSHYRNPDPYDRAVAGAWAHFDGVVASHEEGGT